MTTYAVTKFVFQPVLLFFYTAWPQFRTKLFSELKDIHHQGRNNIFRTWNISILGRGSHGQVMVLCSGSLVFRLEHVPALLEPFRSQSVSVDPVRCTSQPCNEGSAAGEPCCDLNAQCGSGKAGRLRKENRAVRDVL